MSEALMEPAAAVPLDPGRVLRSERESRGLTQDEVAQTLKLNVRQVEAIECGDFASLGVTFARGFVRNYARLLQLDPEPLLQAMGRSLPQGEIRLEPVSNADGAMPQGAPAREVPKPLIVLFGVVVVALAVVMYLERAPGKPPKAPAAEVPAAPPPAASAPLPAPTAEAAPAPLAATAVPEADAKPAAEATGATAQSAPPVAAGKRLAMRFSQESWVEVTDAAGQVLLSRVFAAGTSHELVGSPPLSVVLGNAPGVVVEYDGQAVDLKPHTAVTVARLRLQ